MLAAAGIVVTEIRTPIRAPDLAVESDSIPAAPAQTATKKVKKSGLEMTLAIECEDWSKSSAVRPVALKISVAAKVDAIASGKPQASAIAERRASERRRCTSATQKPAIGPNSGPTTIAPTIRIGESW